ncbi:lysylphosphatidylglycerol synthase domain-containing protein [Methylobacterium sp. Leaf466]|uniref:lysylphosphatidylglycerol synthase domain-containing protein n=1 Tax=Methylobacterium sp. Leaf466 TaxID=1736386 RepID=UPI0006F6B107|nr:lysylphosphatidylglycerol synthase domain-containing protein [Methylobacterium sp. Leaf466]KQT84330.1 hypothetical protein ASG59_02795 [Methylobacterium sp. Leaf466]
MTNARTGAGLASTATRAILRRLPLAATLIGLGLAVWLVATNDTTAIGAAFARIGPLGLAAIVLVRMVILLLCGLGWACLLDRIAAVPQAAFVILRFVREGINTLLPVASVGGDIVGGRLLTFWGAAGTFAAASILVDLLIQSGALVAFAVVGVVLLHQVPGEEATLLAQWASHALIAMTIVLAAFFAFQRAGALRRLTNLVGDLGRRFTRDGGGADTETKPGAPAQAGDVQDALDRVWAAGRRRPLLWSTVLHVAAWFLGAVEIWIALVCLGVEGAGLADAIVIEALTQAIKAMAFPVPSGLGIQEGGFVLVGGLFGLDAGTALALSLVKRVPDVVLGLPALMVWQSLEARRGTVI